MEDDFNTAEACAALFDLASEANRSRSAVDAGLLKALGGLLGLLQRDPAAFLQRRDVAPASASGAGMIGFTGSGSATAIGLPNEQIEDLIVERTAARKARNFAEADRIRKRLEDAGVLLEDGAGGTLWRRK
jgi:cysteinyl-tRNA synthetase